jgi:WD40 repeat protein
MQTLRIFISSPSDVQPERLYAERLIKRLANEFSESVTLEAYFWEYEPMQLAEGFQPQIEPTSDFDIVICILWSRLGTPLTGPDGKHYNSGTEYEVTTALAAWHDRKRPEVMLYINQTPASIKQWPKVDFENAVHQLQAVIEFQEKFCRDPATGQFIGAYNSYKDLGQFEALMEEHLRRIIKHKVPAESAGALESSRRPPVWNAGSPFRGLEVFDRNHELIFFGRTKAIGEVLGQLRRRAQQVDEELARKQSPGNVDENASSAAKSRAGPDVESNANDPATFLLVSAMSGVGKSSLIRAGVLPLLLKDGAIEGVNFWRHAIFRPSDAVGDLLDGLAQVLIKPEALPELVGGGVSAGDLAAQLRKYPTGLDIPIAQALFHAADLAMKDKEAKLRQQLDDSLQQGRANDARRLEQELKLLKPGNARLMLVVDQLEEIFTIQKINEAPEIRKRFVSVLASLARTSRVWIIATMRSDFFARCAELPELMALKQGDGHYDLQPPSKEEIGQIIRQPASAGGLRYETSVQEGIEISLDEVLRDATVDNPAALPLLEFCLDELYKRSGGKGLLTFAAYKELGGVEGALEQRAEAVFSSLSSEQQGAFDRVMRMVTTVGLDKVSVFNRRWADYEQLIASVDSRGFVEAYLSPAARLFIADRTADGRATVSVAHESLLNAWRRLKDWLHDNRESLQVRAQISSVTSQWLSSNRDAGYLLPPGLQLEKARKALAGGYLEQEEREFVAASLSTAESAARKRVQTLQLTIAVVSLLAVAAAIGAYFGFAGEQNAKAESRRAEAESARTKQALSKSDFFQSESYIQNTDPSDALAYLGRSLSNDSANRAALLRFATLLQNNSWPIPTEEVRHAGRVLSVQFSPDGNRFITASSDGTAQVWNSDGGRRVGGPMKHASWVLSAEFSPDGKRVVTASRDNTAQVWEAETGRLLTAPLKHDDWVLAAHFSPDGKRIVTASRGMSRVWDSETGALLLQLPKHRSPIIAAQFSPDGKRIVTAADDGNARIWDAENGEPLIQPLKHDNAMIAAEFSPDGRRIVTLCGDGTAEVSDASTGQQLYQYRNSTTAKFSPDGKRLVIASNDHTAQVFDAETGKALTQQLQHDGNVVIALFSPDGRRLLTVTLFDSIARIWDAETGQLLVEPFRQHARIRMAQFSPDGKRIVIASDDNTATVLDIEMPPTFSESLQHDAAVRAAHFSPDGQLIATASDDGSARIWNAATGQSLTEPLKHEKGLTSICFSPDGKRIVTASKDNTARIWATATGKPLTEPLMHDGRVNTAQFSPDGKRVVTSSADRTARVWDADTGQPLTDPLRHNSDAIAAEFSPDGKRVLSASRGDHLARVWDATTGKQLVELVGHANWLTAAHFSPDGKFIVTASADSTARVWNAANGQPLGEPLTHDAAVVSAEFSPDGKRILTASDDHTAQVWDRETGRPLIESLKLADMLTNARFSPDGALIITACVDGTARIWDAETGQPLTERFQHEGRVLATEFSPDSRRFVTASADNTARVWDFAPRPSKTHVWLPELVEVICRGRLTESGSFKGTEKTPADLINEIRQELRTDPVQDDWVQWTRWFLADPGVRTISPFSQVTVSNYVEQKINENTDTSLRVAEQLSFGNPDLTKRIDDALSALHKNKQP